MANNLTITAVAKIAPGPDIKSPIPLKNPSISLPPALSESILLKESNKLLKPERKDLAFGSNTIEPILLAACCKLETA